MKIILDDFVNDELKKYLMTQDGIKNIDLIAKNCISEINIKFDKRITPKIIKKYMYLFQKNEIPIMLEFDKCTKENYKVLKYIVNDMCCEYCYKSLVEDLFDNEFIISVKSNFDFHKPAFNIEFLIKYSNNYDENKLIQYIKEKTKL